MIRNGLGMILNKFGERKNRDSGSKIGLRILEFFAIPTIGDTPLMIRPGGADSSEVIFHEILLLNDQKLFKHTQETFN